MLLPIHPAQCSLEAFRCDSAGLNAVRSSAPMIPETCVMALSIKKFAIVALVIITLVAVQTLVAYILFIHQNLLGVFALISALHLLLMLWAGIARFRPNRGH